MRNIVNSEEIEQMLTNLGLKHPQLKQWIDSKLKNYMYRQEEIVVVRKESLKKVPSWYKDGQELHTVIIKLDLYEELLIFLSQDLSILKNPVSEAIHAFKQKKDKVFLELKKGYYWVKLSDEESLILEGKRMSHCIGTYSSKVKQGLCEIYSLRNSKDKPLCTVELRSGKLREVSGQYNFAHRPQDYRAIIKLSKYLNADIEDIKHSLNPPFILILSAILGIIFGIQTQGFISFLCYITSFVLVVRFVVIHNQDEI